MQEVIVRLRDDLDNSLDASIATYSFTWIDGQMYEIDLSAPNVAQFETDMMPYIKAARKSKRRQRPSRAKPKQPAVVGGDYGDEPKRKTSQWSAEIHQWATDHGYDWDDKAQRQAVRQWAIESGIHTARSGLLPKHVLQAHCAARRSGEVEWPFSATGFTSE